MVELLVTHMEMTAPPSSIPRPSAAAATIRREALHRSDYLSLYRAVGGPVDWDARLRMLPADLDLLLSSLSTHLHILRIDGVASGFCEFNGVGGAEVELAHFGLAPAAQGKGLGSFLLLAALGDCWTFKPERIWLKTDTNDHPAAVGTYERAGFRSYLRRLETFPD